MAAYPSLNHKMDRERSHLEFDYAYHQLTGPVWGLELTSRDVRYVAAIEGKADATWTSLKDRC